MISYPFYITKYYKISSKKLDKYFKYIDDSEIVGKADVYKFKGKISTSATLPVVYVMCEAIKDYYKKTGIKIGIKAAGGIRTTDEALSYISLVKDILDEEWLTPKLFRIGASSLLNDLLINYKELILKK